MKTVFYCIQYNDGMQEYASDTFDEHMTNESIKNRLVSFGSIRNVIFFGSKEAWESAKNS